MCKGSNTTTTQTAPNPQAMGAYTNVLNQAQGVAQTPFTPYGGQFTAPVNAQQYAGISNINQNAGFASPYINQAAGYATQAAQPIGFQPLTTPQINQYMSPYTQDVVQATQAQFNNQNAQQQAQLTGNAAAQGALGGDRAGIAAANLAGQQQLAEAPVIAGLENTGYQTGLQTAQQQQQMGLQTQLAEQANLGQAAYSLGNLGVAGENAALTGANAQVGAGSLEQQTQQANLSALYNQFEQQQAFPFQETQWLAGVDTGVGSQMGGTSSTTGPPPSLISQLAGLGTAGIGAGQSMTGLSNILPFLGAADGGGVAGFADGGSPGGAMPGIPYGGVAGYIPGLNLTPGHGPPSPPSASNSSQQMMQQAAQLAAMFKNQGNTNSTNISGVNGSSLSNPNLSANNEYAQFPAWTGTGADSVSGDANGGAIAGFAPGGFVGRLPMNNRIMVPPRVMSGPMGGNRAPMRPGGLRAGFAPGGHVLYRDDGGATDDGPANPLPGFNPVRDSGLVAYPDDTNVQPVIGEGGQVMGFAPAGPISYDMADIPQPRSRPNPGQDLGPSAGESSGFSADMPVPASTPNDWGSLNNVAAGLTPSGAQRGSAGQVAGLGPSPAASGPPQAAPEAGGVAGFVNRLINPMGLKVNPNFGDVHFNPSPAGLGLMAAGFGMMASRSPFPGVAIGEGALTGMQTYAAATKQEESAKDAARKLDIEADKAKQEQQRETAAEANRNLMAQQGQERIDIARQAQDPARKLEYEKQLLALKNDPAMLKAAADAKRTGAEPPEAIDFRAEMALAGNPRATQGLRAGTQAAADFAEAFARKAAEQGLPPKAINDRQALYAGQISGQRVLANREANLLTIGNEARDAIPLAIQNSQATDRHGSATWNALQQKWETEFGDEKWADHITSTNALVHLYARARSGGQETVSGVEEGHQLLNPAMPPAAYNARVKTMAREINRFLQAPGETREQMLSGKVTPIDVESIGKPAPSAAVSPGGGGAPAPPPPGKYIFNPKTNRLEPVTAVTGP